MLDQLVIESSVHLLSGLVAWSIKYLHCWVCSNRAATREENIRTQQKTAPLRHSEFGLYKENLEEVRKHKKSLCCLHTAEVAGSNPASPTSESGVLQDKYHSKEKGRIKLRPFLTVNRSSQGVPHRPGGLISHRG
jgi:hypothetical protein